MAALSTQYMLPALSAAAMREADQFTIDTLGLPGFTLMESAGRTVLPAIEAHFNITRHQLGTWHVACLCGKGNNGGDGLVVARVLASAGARVLVWLMAPRKELSADSISNLAILEQLAALDKTLRVDIQVKQTATALPPAGPYDLIVDGLLGTGITSQLRADYADAVNWINQQHAPTVALDIPTGLHADLGTVQGVAVKADLTVTMGAMKTGLLCNDGPACAGHLKVAEIGIPRAALDRAVSMHAGAYVTTRNAVASWLPVRQRDTHKYAEGMALVVAGDAGMAGAATLAATAAARSGAGAVLCAAPASVQPVLATKMTEVMTLGLPADADDGIASKPALALLAAHQPKATALLIGCGMGRKPHTQAFIRALAAQTTLPTIIDADGLNAFAGYLDELKNLQQPVVLTPHWGEFRKLSGVEHDPTDRLALVAAYAKKWQCILVLKGAPTVVGTPDGQLFISPIVNPALATAGSGDVLAGLCAGLLAQGLTPVQSALAALYLGGEAANHYTQHNHPATLMASDLIAHFNTIMNAYKS